MIDRDNLWKVSARYNDAIAEERGMEDTLKHMGIVPGEISEVAEQRALRMILLLRGEKANYTSPQRILISSAEREMLAKFAAAFMDGMAIGWKARELRELEKQEQANE